MRWLIRAAGAVVLLVAIGAGALVAVPTERIATLATERIAAATGRAVSISGPIRPTLWPYLGVRAEGLSVGNPDWVQTGPLIAAEALQVGVRWSALLGGEVRLERAELRGPDITLVTAADGRVSWDFGTGSAAPAPEAAEDAAAAGGGPLDVLAFDRAEISGGRLRWIDQSSGQDLIVEAIDAVLSLPSAQGRATIVAEAKIAGEAFDLEAAIEGLGPLLAGEVRLATLALDWPGGRAGFDGRLSLAPALDGEIAVEATDLGPVLALAGSAAPDLPRGLGRDAISLAGRLTLATEGTLHLRGGALGLDDNRIATEFDLLPGTDRPMLRGTLSAQSLAFAMPTGGGPSQGTANGWPVDRIDVTGLFAADADIAMALGAVEVDGLAVGPVDMSASLTRGRLVLDIARAGIYGGRLSGQFVVNGRGGLSVGGDLNLAAVQLNPLLSEMADWDRLEGSGSASLRFLGVGNDLATIMAGLEGEGDLSFGAGAIRGLDIAGMLRNLDAGYQGEGARTVYDSITGNFTITGGVLSNEDLLLDAPWGEVQGTGTVDIGRQALDYRVIPGVLRDETGVAGVQVPVRITGSWDAPRFRPDLEYLAQQELEAERARLEEAARARIEAERERLAAEALDRANAALGTELGADATVEDVEDAVTDRLMDAVAPQVLQLLGGGAPPLPRGTDGAP